MNTQGHLDSSGMLSYYAAMRLFTEGMTAVAPNFTRDALVKWLSGVRNLDLQIQPPIRSMAPSCKQGTGQSWWAKWRWDAQKNEAYRTPDTPYMQPTRWAQKYGGDCYITQIADKILGVR
jgi:hypothetical protein